MTCPGCDLPIKNSDVRRTESGEVWHSICFDISVANLEAEIEASLLANPQKYERLANGKFRFVGQ